MPMIAKNDRSLDVDLHMTLPAAGATEGPLDELEASVREAVVCALYRHKAVTRAEAAKALGVTAWELRAEVLPRNGVHPNDGYGIDRELDFAAQIVRDADERP